MADIKLCQKLAEAIGAGNSPIMLKIFDALVNDEDAKVLLAAAGPSSPEEIAERSGVTLEKVNAMLEPLFQKGLIFKGRKGDSLKYYRVKSVPQMHDATALTPGLSRKVLDLWKDYMKNEWPAYGRKVMEIMPAEIVRVVPVNESVEAESRILPYDDVVKIVENAKTLSVTNCSCRVISGQCGNLLETCMQVDRAAEYNIERGTGRKLDKKEALEILRKCRNDGLIHVVDNRQVVGHVICNCCKDCCMNWQIMTGAKKWVAPSRFEAHADGDTCTGCENCIDQCFFGAIRMENDVAVVDKEKCLGCGVCTVFCPTEAIRLKETRPADFVPA
jgi:ferredoxin